jgi:hypothetical protein
MAILLGFTHSFESARAVLSENIVIKTPILMAMANESLWFAYCLYSILKNSTSETSNGRKFYNFIAKLDEFLFGIYFTSIGLFVTSFLYNLIFFRLFIPALIGISLFYIVIIVVLVIIHYLPSHFTRYPKDEENGIVYRLLFGVIQLVSITMWIAILFEIISYFTSQINLI